MSKWHTAVVGITYSLIFYNNHFRSFFGPSAYGFNETPELLYGTLKFIKLITKLNFQFQFPVVWMVQLFYLVYNLLYRLILLIQLLLLFVDTLLLFLYFVFRTVS